MDQQFLVIVFVLSVVALILVGLYFWRMRGASVKPGANAQPSTDEDTTTPTGSYLDMETSQLEDGTTIASLSEGADHQATARHTTLAGRLKAWLTGQQQPAGRKDQGTPPARRSPVMKVLLVLVLIAALSALLWQMPGLVNVNLASPRALMLRTFSQDRFVVLVAPFHDGGDGETGHNVASALVEKLKQQAADRLIIVALKQAPTTEEQALALTSQYAADVLIWGDVQPGGLLDDTTLSPRLTYTPSGAYGPNAWVDYSGRFVMPHSYVLIHENTPINGSVVVPALLLALEDYSNGSADNAYAALGDLLADTLNPLHPSLPRALRGNVLWARGDYDQAVAEYTTAIDTLANSRDQGMLTNNQGAILLDKGDIAGAEGALTRSFQMLGDDNLAALHLNLGMLAQQQGRGEDAIASFEKAHSMLPQHVALRLALTDLYRTAGQLAAAETMLKEAEHQIRKEVASVPESLRGAMQGYLNAETQEQRGLLALAQCVDACGPVAWEVEVLPVRSSLDMSAPLNATRAAVETTGGAIAQWRGRAAAAEASLKIEQQVDDIADTMVGDGQAQRLEEALHRQQYHLALMLIEEERTNYTPEHGIFEQLWATVRGGSQANREAEQILRELLLVNPDNVRVLVAYARVSWLRFNFSETAARYEDVRNRAPQAPDGYYGAGILALERGDREAARQWMRQALDRDATFFPARIKLAELLQPQQPGGDWSETLTHLRLLMEQYPCANSAVRLASALRQSGSDGVNEAQELLLALEEKDAEVYLELARVYRAQQQTDTAIGYYEDARKAEDPPVEAWVELGDLRAEQGQTQEAINEFQSAVNWDGSNIPARLALANLYLKNPDTYDEADEQYRYIISKEKSGPGTVDAATLLMMGTVLMEHNQPEMAKEAFHLGIDQQPTNASLHHSLGSAYLVLENVTGARSHEQRALDLVGQSDPQLRAQVLVGMGNVEQWEQNFNDAISFYNQALATDPTLVRAHLGLGQVALKQQNWAMAQGHFERAIATPAGENNPVAHFWYAEALLRQDRLQEASEQYHRVMELQEASEVSPYPEALLGLAHVQYARNEGDGMAAERTIDQALELRPDYAEALLFKGKLLQERGQMSDALAAYNASIRANNQLFETHYLRGLIFLEQQEYGRAAQDMRIATQLQPTNDEVYYWLGRAKLGQNRLQQARDAFAQAVAMQGEFLDEAQTYLTLVEEELGDRAAGQ